MNFVKAIKTVTHQAIQGVITHSQLHDKSVAIEDCAFKHRHDIAKRFAGYNRIIEQ